MKFYYPKHLIFSFRKNDPLQHTRISLLLSLVLVILLLNSSVLLGRMSYSHIAYTPLPVGLICPGNSTINNDPGQCNAFVTVSPPIVTEGGVPAPVVGPLTTFNVNGSNQLIDTPTLLEELTYHVVDVSLEIFFTGDFSDSSECFDLTGPDGSLIYSVCDVGNSCIDVNDSVTIPAATWNGWLDTFGRDLTFTLLGDPDVEGDVICIDNHFQLTLVYPLTYTLTNDYNGTDDASDTYPVGTTTVTWTVVDFDGTTDTCSMDVTVVDAEAPAITCPDDITVEQDGGICGAVVDYTLPIVSDNCLLGGIPSTFIPMGEYNDKAYFLSVGTATAPDAFTEAESLGAYLATIPDAATNNFVRTAANDAGWGGAILIGYNDIAVEGTFEWHSGAPVTYENWIPGQPDATFPLEDYVVMRNTEQWNDIPDGTGRRYVIEFDLSPTQTAGLPSGSVFPMGTTTNTFEYTDNSGNTTTCSFDVTVLDTVPPVLDSCPSDVVVPTAAGTCEAILNVSLPNATDTCSGVTVTSDPSPGTILPWGTHIITVTATDDAGNTDTCSFNFVVQDNEAPIVTCPADIVVNNDPGTCGAVVTFPNATAVDNCTPTQVLQILGPPSGSVFPVGTTIVGFEGFDLFGNSDVCFFTVTVNDVEAPEIACPGTIAANSELGRCDAEVMIPSPVVSDLCDSSFVGPMTVFNFVGGSLADTPTLLNGVRPVIPGSGNVRIDIRFAGDFDEPSECFLLRNPAGITYATECNEMACTEDSTVALVGSTTWNNLITTYGPALTFTLEADSDVDLASCSTNYFQLEITYPDAINITNDFNGTDDASDRYPVGTTTVNWTAVDAFGNSSTCSMDVVVTDTEAPEITCSDNITAVTDPGFCEANVSVSTPNILGICDTGTEFTGPLTDMIFVSNDLVDTPTTIAGLPSTTGDVTMEVYFEGEFDSPDECFVISGPDGMVLFSECAPETSRCVGTFRSFIVQMDTWNSWITTFGPDLTFTLEGDEDVGEISDCSDTFQLKAFIPVLEAINDYTGTNDASGVYPVGTTIVTWTVADAAGNESSCTMEVTVIDNEPPNVVCQDIVLSLDDLGNATITAVDVLGVNSDNCGVASTSLDINNFDCSNIGDNQVEVTVTDVSGNQTTCTAVVTIQDTTPPEVLCQDITVTLDASGQASITPADIEISSSDNCGIASKTLDIDTFDCSDVEPIEVALFVTDTSGNEAFCLVTVNVVDDTPPVAVCQDITVTLDASGQASISPADIDAGSSDVCGIVNYNLDIDTFDCSHIGDNMVTLTVADQSGNMTSCVATVTVEDTNVPTVLCQDITVELDTSGQATIVPSDIDNGSSAVCGIEYVELDINIFDCSNIGDNTVTLTVTDFSGNQATCTATVTVQDTTPPTVECQNIIISLDDSGSAAITAVDVLGVNSDNCGVASSSIDISTFDCSNIGDNNVVLTLTDASGNEASCTAVVTVQDTTLPNVVCQDITVSLDASGQVTISPTDIGAGSNDNCGIAESSIDVDTFDCSHIGENTVILTVTDTNGNTASCEALVTIVDDTAPELICMDISLSLDENGMASIVPEDVIASNSDACGIFTSAVDIFEFDCEDIGTPVTVQIFTEDIHGNIATCFATVTVVDDLAPELTCPADQTVDPGPGNLFYEVPDYFAIGEASAIDNCTDPLTITSQDPEAGTLLPDGNYTITLSAEDAFGNVATCEFTLTVESTLGQNDVGVLAGVEIYPNPAKDHIVIENPLDLELETLTVFDLLGRRIQLHDLSQMSGQRILDVSFMDSAVYVLVIQGKNGKLVQQLIKE
ncbi:HYR domain-containing protein [Aureisphaera galaxeae]|uniref:HYR domain-containing protein n=1 Tax=Aureisphaera galaxeae TaxID=1538023 RepID=UPI002350C56E|nr:HYR domain-containing protein [Aureisphaera galaxeae]MDC8002463.1 HYR domain-containing protein [Aureisphaera galaxeae]